VDLPLYVAVVGSGEVTGELYEKARDVGRLVASRGRVVVCGGLVRSSPWRAEILAGTAA
jgi:hypothetical protein